MQVTYEVAVSYLGGAGRLGHMLSSAEVSHEMVIKGQVRPAASRTQGCGTAKAMYHYAAP